jgi:hypothetical protein
VSNIKKFDKGTLRFFAECSFSTGYHTHVVTHADFNFDVDGGLASKSVENILRQIFQSTYETGRNDLLSMVTSDPNLIERDYERSNVESLQELVSEEPLTTVKVEFRLEVSEKFKLSETDVDFPIVSPKYQVETHFKDLSFWEKEVDASKKVFASVSVPYSVLADNKLHTSFRAVCQEIFAKLYGQAANSSIDLDALVAEKVAVIGRNADYYEKRRLEKEENANNA